MARTLNAQVQQYNPQIQDITYRPPEVPSMGGLFDKYRQNVARQNQVEVMQKKQALDELNFKQTGETYAGVVKDSSAYKTWAKDPANIVTAGGVSVDDKNVVDAKPDSSAMLSKYMKDKYGTDYSQGMGQQTFSTLMSSMKEKAPKDTKWQTYTKDGKSYKAPVLPDNTLDYSKGVEQFVKPAGTKAPITQMDRVSIDAGNSGYTPSTLLDTSNPIGRDYQTKLLSHENKGGTLENFNYIPKVSLPSNEGLAFKPNQKVNLSGGREGTAVATLDGMKIDPIVETQAPQSYQGYIDKYEDVDESYSEALENLNYNFGFDAYNGEKLYTMMFDAYGGDEKKIQEAIRSFTKQDLKKSGGLGTALKSMIPSPFDWSDIADYDNLDEKTKKIFLGNMYSGGTMKFDKSKGIDVKTGRYPFVLMDHAGRPIENLEKQKEYLANEVKKYKKDINYGVKIMHGNMGQGNTSPAETLSTGMVNPTQNLLLSGYNKLVNLYKDK